jgi:protein-tyrosine phosphatase
MSLNGPNEIIENLFVGDMMDSMNFDGMSICVLEQRDTLAKNATWIPILTYLPTSVDGVTIPKADKKQLDAAAEVIDSALQGGKKVLVHCAAGIERSPLTVVWYLHRKKNMSIEDAYNLVIDKRSIVQRRDLWL